MPNRKTPFDMANSPNQGQNLLAASADGFFKGYIAGTFTFDPGSLVDAAGETKNIAVPGVALGDIVMVSCPFDLLGMTVNAYVSAANQITVRVQNESGTTRDILTGTWRYIIFDVT